MTSLAPLQSDFPAQVVVLCCALASVVNDADRVRQRYPDAALVIVDIRPHRELMRTLEGIGAVAVVESNGLDAVLTQLHASALLETSPRRTVPLRFS